MKIKDRFKISLDWLISGTVSKSDIEGFGEFSRMVKQMLNDMRREPGFKHTVLSHDHLLKTNQ